MYFTNIIIVQTLLDVIIDYTYNAFYNLYNYICLIVTYFGSKFKKINNYKTEETALFPLSENIQKQDENYYSYPDIEMGGISPMKPRIVSFNIVNSRNHKQLNPSVKIKKNSYRLHVRIPNNISSFHAI